MKIVFVLVILVSDIPQPIPFSTRAKPRCTACGNLMKGHKNVVDCIKNQRWIYVYCLILYSMCV